MEVQNRNCFVRFGQMSIDDGWKKGFFMNVHEDSICTQDALRKKIRKQLVGIIKWEIPNDTGLQVLV